MKFISQERSRVAYRIGNEGMEFDHVVEPGLNEVDDHTAHALRYNEAFHRHAAHGFIVLLDKDGTPLPAPELDEPLNPNRRQPEPMPIARVHRVVAPRVDAPADQASMPNRATPGTDPATTPEIVTDIGVKPLTAGDTAQPGDADFVAAWASMDQASRDAMLPTLDDHQKALVASVAPAGA